MESTPHTEPQEEQAGLHPDAAGASASTDVRSVSPKLPEIPAPDLDLSLSLDSIIGAGNPESAKIQKRASNVMKLAQENEKLKAELKAMTDRLEAAERKRAELASRSKGSVE